MNIQHYWSKFIQFIFEKEVTWVETEDQELWIGDESIYCGKADILLSRYIDRAWWTFMKGLFKRKRQLLLM